MRPVAPGVSEDGRLPQSLSQEAAPEPSAASSLASRLGSCFLARPSPAQSSPAALQDSVSSFQYAPGKLKPLGTKVQKGQRSIKTLLQAPFSKFRRAALACTGAQQQQQAGLHSRTTHTLGSHASERHQRPNRDHHTSPQPHLATAPKQSRRRIHTLSSAVSSSLVPCVKSSQEAPKRGASASAERPRSQRASRSQEFPRSQGARQAGGRSQATRHRDHRPKNPNQPANPFLLAAAQRFQDQGRSQMTADHTHSIGSNVSNAASSNTIPSAFRMSTSTSGLAEEAQQLSAPPSFATWEPEDVRICKRPDGTPWKLGDGGSSTVYKGLLCNLYPVAIKVVSDTTVTQKRNFKREVKILSNLRCPNVLSFVGACHLPGCTALISEFCQRGDLFHALAADRETRMLSWHRSLPGLKTKVGVDLSPKVLLLMDSCECRGKAIAIDIVKGLSFMHRNHIIHFDIKSPNILLDDNCAGKICDVGIAKYTVRDFTSLGQAFGSWDWASPEQILCQECSSRTDIYSLGVVLWEIVTGERPTRNKMRNIRVPEECPQEVADLIAACRDNNPAHRPIAQQVLAVLQGDFASDSRERAQLPPPSYLCPITGQLMQDPVILVETGITFEKQAIRDWFNKGRHRNCPQTNQPVTHVQLVSNVGLRQAIKNWENTGTASENAFDDNEDLLNTRMSTASSAQPDMKRPFSGIMSTISTAPRSTVLVDPARSGPGGGSMQSGGSKAGTSKLGRLPGSLPSVLSRKALREHARIGDSGVSAGRNGDPGASGSQADELGPRRMPSIESIGLSPVAATSSPGLGASLAHRQGSLPPTLASSLRHCVSTSQRKLADNIFLANIDGCLEEEPASSNLAGPSTPPEVIRSNPNPHPADDDQLPQDPIPASSSSFSSSQTSSDAEKGDELLPEWVAALHRQSNTAFAAAACALCRLIDKQPKNFLNVVLVICREDPPAAAETQQAASNALLSPGVRSEIFNVSLQLLVRLVQSSSRKLQVSAAHVIGALVQNARVQRSTLVDLKVAEALTPGLSSPSTCAQWACCRSLEFLAYMDQQHSTPVLSKSLLKTSLGPLVEVVETAKSPPAKKHAVMALGHLASNVSSRQQIMRSGAIPRLILDLREAESPVSQEAAAYALHRLADSLETHMLMLRCDVLPPTLPLLGTASPKTQQYAASLLVALATGEKSARRAMLSLDVFGRAICLLRSSTPRLQLAGIDLLAVMAQDSAGREALQASDTHLLLSGMLHDENARSMAAAALRTLLECKAYTLADLETAGADEAVLNRLRSPPTDKPRADGMQKSPLTGNKAWRLLFGRTGA